MTIIRWNPDRSLANRDMDRLLDSFFTRSFAPAQSPALTLAVDVAETPEAFVFRADLPGLDPKDVKVKMDGDVLSIRGERRREESQNSGRYHRTERAFGAFERTFTLNTAVRADRIEASYRNGVLEVHVPKAEEAKAREIEVQVR
jgi:HSP20 family protein